MLNESDRDYVEKTVYSCFTGHEKLIRSIKNQLRIYFSNYLKNRSIDIKRDFWENKGKLLILEMVKEFLKNNNLQGTCMMLEMECSDLLGNDVLELDKVIEEIEKNNVIINEETTIERLLKLFIQFRKNYEIDEVTNSALIEASDCIESLQNEIQNLHLTYLEQVNTARAIMEEKVKDIEKLYLESLEANKIKSFE